VLYNFGTKNGDPLDPGFQGIIAQGRDGNFYSTTSNGGTALSGDILKITPTGSLTGIHNFDGTVECLPLSGLTLGTDGNFYGTTEGCGTTMLGTVFKITPGGSFTVLHNFTNMGDGGIPNAPPIQGTDGNFYGTTHGSLTGGGSGTVYNSRLPAHSRRFSSSTALTVNFPQLLWFKEKMGTGILYGDTFVGGTHGQGTFFSLNVGPASIRLALEHLRQSQQTIEIIGNGLTGTTSVKFGTGSAITFHVVSDTYMTAVIPVTGTTGSVTVTTPSGIRVSSKKFRVIPVISGFSPTSGPDGTQVVITGTGLTQTDRQSYFWRSCSYELHQNCHAGDRHCAQWRSDR